MKLFKKTQKCKLYIFFLIFELRATGLTLSCRRSLSYRNHQSTDLLFKSMAWFLCDRDLHHERVKCVFIFNWSFWRHVTNALTTQSNIKLHLRFFNWVLNTLLQISIKKIQFTLKCVKNIFWRRLRDLYNISRDVFKTQSNIYRSFCKNC